MRKLVASGHYVVNIDARGHGDSAWAMDGDYTIETLAHDLAGVIAELPPKPALVGASMGGAAALYLVGALQPSLASALILVDIVPMIDPAGAAKIIEFMNGHADGFATLEEAADAVAAYNPHRPRPTTCSGLIKNLRRRADGRLYWHWDPSFTRGAENTEPPMRVAKLTRAADGVRIPTLLVRGLKSDIVTDEGVADLKLRVPQLEVFDVAEAGHMVAGDNNDTFSQGVFDFLQRQFPLKAGPGVPAGL
jgi:pimeloyl-ACP methyl ester carboxylesterase